MRKPKGFNKMSLKEQETWLVKERIKLEEMFTLNSRELAKVRGGNKVQIKESERLDEIELK